MRFLSIYKTAERATPPTPEEIATFGKLVDDGMKAGFLLATMVRQLERDLPELLAFFSFPRPSVEKAAHHQHHRALFRRSTKSHPAHGLLCQREKRGPDHLLHLPEI